MRTAVLAVAAVLCGTASGQAPAKANTPADQETVVSAEQLQTMLAGAVSKDGKPADLSTSLFGRVASCSFIRLTEPDLPHVHPVSEIYVIKEGAGTLETGGTMLGPFTNGGVHHQAGGNGGQAQQPAAQPVGPDHAGSALEGGHSQQVKAGDVILVPAGVNHHWTKITQPLVYLDIKFPKAE